jgi:LysR family transcriptional regulator, nitrogen assimilation regulatory protein
MGEGMSASIRDLKLFVAAYEERSFTAAAIREGATQSGVSQHIAKLEALLDVKLFSRSANGLLSTPAADAYYNRTVEVLRAHEGAHSVLKGYARGLHGEIRVGLMPSMTRCVLAPALAKFIELHPNVSVRVLEGYSGILTKQVKAAELEFAIVPAFSDVTGLRSRLLMTTPELLVTKNSRKKSEPFVRLADLSPLKVVVPGKGNSRRKSLDTYFSSNGVRVDRLLELDAMLGTLDFVLNTDWAAILPAIMMSNPTDSRTFDVRVISNPTLTLDLFLIEAARRPISTAAEILLGFLREEMDRLNKPWLAMSSKFLLTGRDSRRK